MEGEGAGQGCSSSHNLLADCLIVRAKSQRELGNLKAAIIDCTQSMQFTSAASDTEAKACRVQAFTIRSQVLEQLERYEDSAADLEVLLDLQPGELAASAALARVRKAATGVTEHGPSAAAWSGWTSVPRPGLRHFEHRGKAGAAF